MNTIGKILVVLNFLFAIIVGVLLVFDFATRNKWKEAYDNLEREARIHVNASGNTKKSLSQIVEDYKNAQQKYVDLQKEKEDLEVRAKVAEDKYNLDVEDYKNKLKEKDITLAAAAAAKQRLTEEIEAINKTLKDREMSIAAQEKSIRSLQNEALTQRQLAMARQTQNENLIEQLRDVSRKLAQLEGGINPDADVIRNPNAPNPPAVNVKGKIEKVDGDLVQINLGTDHGVNKNNTLDVFRTTPTAKYIGMIRIIDATPHKSVARIVPVGAQARPQVKEGDQVASKLSR